MNESEVIWTKIEKAASSIVEKSGHQVSEAAAIAKYLETAEGRLDYSDYVAAKGMF